MGQIYIAGAPPSIILSAVDRLVASNADGGLSPAASHVILLGEAAGRNLAASNVIALGWKAFQGGLTGWPAGDADNSTVIGENTFPGPGDLTTGKANGLGAVTIVGASDYAAVTTSRRMAGLIMLGAGIAPNFDGINGGGMDRSILIGNSIFKNNTLDNALSSDNIIIGHGAAARVSLNGQATQYIGNVIIGPNAGPQVDTVSSIIGNTIVGTRAGQGLSGTGGDNTIIGRQAANALVNGIQNIVIGQGAELGGSATDTVIVGTQSTKAQSNDSLYLGCGQSNNVTGARNIHIGRGAGESEASPNSDRLIVETVDGGGIRRGVLYGDMGNGNLLSGLSTPGAQRVFRGTVPPTNAFRLLNGTAGTGTNPTSGGFFYCVAGALHFFDQNGIDWLLTQNASLGIFAVAALPAAPPQGATAYANDALAPAFGVAVAPGGAVFVPVYFDGATWIVG